MADQRTAAVVTGGAGFIGSHLVDALLAHGADVHVVDNLATGRRERVPDGATFHEVDVTDADELARVADEAQPTTWYHLAAQADVRVSVEDPIADAQANVIGTISVLQAALRTDADVVFASTGGAIYGEDNPIPTPETAHEAPLSPYGAAKLAAEAYVHMHARLNGRSHAIVRYANVYGPRQDPHGEAGVVAIFGGRLLDGEEATVYGDGAQTRDYVYVGDVVEATIAAGERSSGDGDGVPVYNVGTGVETSVVELWKLMERAAGRSPGYRNAPARPGELQRSALDASKLQQELGVRLDTPLEQGLARTLEWLRDARAVAWSRS